MALDLGGTNFRVLLVELKGHRHRPAHVVSKVFLIPPKIMLGTAQMASCSHHLINSRLMLHSHISLLRWHGMGCAVRCDAMLCFLSCT